MSEFTTSSEIPIFDKISKLSAFDFAVFNKLNLLILPLAKKTEHISGGTRIRIVFDGEESTMPVISNLVLDCRVPVNIMYADTKDIDGKAFGQMVIEVENTFVSQVCDYLDSIKIKHEEVQ